MGGAADHSAGDDRATRLECVRLSMREGGVDLSLAREIYAFVTAAAERAATDDLVNSISDEITEEIIKHLSGEGVGRLIRGESPRGG